MEYFFSPSTGGYFISGINTSVPSDAIKIEYELYRELALMPRKPGEVVVIDEGTGLPMLSGRPSPWHCWDGEKWAIDSHQVSEQLAAKRQDLLLAINAERDRREASTFQYRGRKIDCDPRAAQRITAAAVAAQSALATGQPFSLDWMCADNSVLTLDAAGVAGMPLALAAFADALHHYARSLKQAVLEAEDLAALAVIDIQAGWPEE